VREEKITLIASLFERRAPGLYHNTAAVLDHTSEKPDNIAGLYRKMHIPDDPLYYEKFYFTPGDLGFRAFQPATEASARSSAGTSGTRRLRG
jgi:N-carbamoylputrescine amidase